MLPDSRTRGSLTTEPVYVIYYLKRDLTEARANVAGLTAYIEHLRDGIDRVIANWHGDYASMSRCMEQLKELLSSHTPTSG